MPFGIRTRSLVLAIVAVTLLGFAWLLTRHLTLEQLAAEERLWRQWIHDSPVLSVLAALAFYSVVSLIPGTSGKSIVAGWLFGAATGLLIVMFGLEFAALVSFVLGRYLIREFVETKLSGLGQFLNAAIRRDGPFYLLTLRMAHAPFTVLNYACAVSRIRVGTFVWTTFVGHLPTSALFVWFGATLPTLHELADQGPWALFDMSLIFVFVLVGFLPLLVRGVVSLGMRIAGRSPKPDPDPESYPDPGASDS